MPCRRLPTSGPVWAPTVMRAAARLEFWRCSGGGLRGAAGAMADRDSPPAHTADRYRELANSVRRLIPLMNSSAARLQLGLLAIGYERLAQCVEAVSDAPRTPAAPE
jgi:hypothetical protein